MVVVVQYRVSSVVQLLSNVKLVCERERENNIGVKMPRRKFGT